MTCAASARPPRPARHRAEAACGQHQPALVQRDGPAGAPRPALPVRDQEHGPPGHQPLDGVDDHPGGERVQVRGGLVEQQQRRVLEERPGQRDPLPLARGQPRAALPQRRGVVTGQRPDELRGAGQGGRVRDVRRGGVRAAQGDVAGHGAVEQVRVLRHPGDLAAPARPGRTRRCRCPAPRAARPRSAPRSARRTAAAGPAASSCPRRWARSPRSAHRAGSPGTPGPALARRGPGTPARFR